MAGRSKGGGNAGSGLLPESVGVKDACGFLKDQMWSREQAGWGQGLCCLSREDLSPNSL